MFTEIFSQAHVLAFHKQMEKNFVMDKGIHDMGLLESAVSTPFQTFGGQELYDYVKLFL